MCGSTTAMFSKLSGICPSITSAIACQVISAQESKATRPQLSSKRSKLVGQESVLIDNSGPLRADDPACALE
jgi:hypothetical protein